MRADGGGGAGAGGGAEVPYKKAFIDEARNLLTLKAEKQGRTLTSPIKAPDSNECVEDFNNLIDKLQTAIQSGQFDKIYAAVLDLLTPLSNMRAHPIRDTGKVIYGLNIVNKIVPMFIQLLTDQSKDILRLRSALDEAKRDIETEKGKVSRQKDGEKNEALEEARIAAETAKVAAVTEAEKAKDRVIANIQKSLSEKEAEAKDLHERLRKAEAYEKLLEAAQEERKRILEEKKEIAAQLEGLREKAAELRTVATVKERAETRADALAAELRTTTERKDAEIKALVDEKNKLAIRNGELEHGANRERYRAEQIDEILSRVATFKAYLVMWSSLLPAALANAYLHDRDDERRQIENEIESIKKKLAELPRMQQANETLRDEITRLREENAKFRSDILALHPLPAPAILDDPDREAPRGPGGAGSGEPRRLAERERRNAGAVSLGVSLEGAGGGGGAAAVVVPAGGATPAAANSPSAATASNSSAPALAGNPITLMGAGNKRPASVASGAASEEAASNSASGGAGEEGQPLSSKRARRK